MASYRNGGRPSGLFTTRVFSPQSVWKLAYAGSVGSQGLLGIPVVHRLRWDSQLQGVSLVWPFEITVPSIPAGRPGVVHAEIWPSAAPFDHELGRCPGEQQVRAVVRLWQDQDQRQALGEMFAAVPADEDIRRERDGFGHQLDR
jgi:hypothetical protein